jgi:hypothetical protein
MLLFVSVYFARRRNRRRAFLISIFHAEIAQEHLRVFGAGRLCDFWCYA